jgi:hypothetical protein
MSVPRHKTTRLQAEPQEWIRWRELIDAALLAAGAEGLGVDDGTPLSKWFAQRVSVNRATELILDRRRAGRAQNNPARLAFRPVRGVWEDDFPDEGRITVACVHRRVLDLRTKRRESARRKVARWASTKTSSR